jgi:ankyrin repeat protein
MSALHLASESGHGAVSDALLAHNAFVNSKSRVGLTPIHLAALKGYTELVRSLVTVHGATIDALTLVKNKKTNLNVLKLNDQLNLPFDLFLAEGNGTSIGSRSRPAGCVQSFS